MSVLIGQNGLGWTLAGNFLTGSGGRAAFCFAGYIGTTGTATGFYFYNNSVQSSTTVKVCVYDAGGSLVATSPAISVTTTGLHYTAASSSFSVTAQQYWLVVVPDSGYVEAVKNSGSSDFANRQIDPANFSYSSPPSTIPTTYASNNGAEFIVWVEGTTTPLYGTLGQFDPNMRIEGWF